MGLMLLKTDTQAGQGILYIPPCPSGHMSLMSGQFVRPNSQYIDGWIENTVTIGKQ